MSDGNLGQTRVLRSCFATRPFRGLGFVEERTRGIHQGWAVSRLFDKAEYMSATEPDIVMTSYRLAKKGRSIYVAKLIITFCYLQYMAFFTYLHFNM
jgi:hypothetical protein